MSKSGYRPATVRAEAPLEIDGAMGEGGGQVLRSALALSMCSALQGPAGGGRAFHMTNIRAARRRPGLQPQHLAAVQAAAAVCGAGVEGAARDSTEITFTPDRVRPGEYHFATGTAGSATLVLQTVLPALLTASAPSRLVITGGTHNPLAPSFDFLALAFLPLLNRMGPRVTAHLLRPGFYPAGGGEIVVDIQPSSELHPFTLHERGALLERYATAAVSHLPRHIAERELRVLGRTLGLPDEALHTRVLTGAYGPGNVISVVIRSEWVTEVFTGFGERGVPAEVVAAGVVAQVERYLAAGVPVGERLADQLLVPLALAGGGGFLTLRPSRHTTTNAAVIERFLPVRIVLHELAPERWRVDVSAPGNRPTG